MDAKGIALRAGAVLLALDGIADFFLWLFGKGNPIYGWPEHHGMILAAKILAIPFGLIAAGSVLWLVAVLVYGVGLWVMKGKWPEASEEGELCFLIWKSGGKEGAK